MKKYIYIVFRDEILNMCYEITEFDSAYDDESLAKARVEYLKKYSRGGHYEKTELNQE